MMAMMKTLKALPQEEAAHLECVSSWHFLGCLCKLSVTCCSSYLWKGDSCVSQAHTASCLYPSLPVAEELVSQVLALDAEQHTCFVSKGRSVCASLCACVCVKGEVGEGRESAREGAHLLKRPGLQISQRAFVRILE